ncbi:MAG: hypothetical protein K8L99_11660 [Anaerolineae bacterium]|nr:hypothetical protein [Anaerolineae bacterium]
MKKYSGFLLVFLLLAVFSLPLYAQDMMTPAVEVSDQVSLDGTVTVDYAYSEGPGFVVIHVDNGEGAPGPVAGHAALSTGANYNVQVDMDTSIATPTLFAMLHTDTGEVGTYEFGTVEGADGPVADADGNVITPPFNVDLIHASDQMLAGSTFTVGTVVAQADGWLVVHAGDAESFGAVLGQTQVSAGANSNVTVELSGDITPVLWPMLHVDTGEAGVYEFGTVEGADGPVAVNGNVATTPVWTVPHMRVADQIVTHGDGMEMMEGMAPTLIADSVLAAEDGWLVVHAGDAENFGAVLGQTQVSAGLNEDVMVELSGDITPVLWPMLHVDTDEAGVYEFGTVEGADGPVAVDGNVVTFPINAAPSIDYSGTYENGTVTVDSAVIDAPGWLVIHADNDGAPGMVLGQAPLHTGVNHHIAVMIGDVTTAQVFPMLHYDTGEAGVYEFGTVEGADSPVAVGGSVIVGPFALGGEMASMDETTRMTDGCSVTSLSGNVNLRTGPGTNYDIAGTLAGQAMTVAGQAQGSDGFIWWNLDDGSWVRSDIAAEEGACDSVATVAAPAAAPAMTEEASS